MSQPETSTQNPDAQGEVCSGCKAVMPVGAKICTNCGRNFKTGLALPGADAEEIVIEDDASTWDYYRPLLIKLAAVLIVVGIIGGGALGLKALVRKQTRESLHTELKRQLYNTDGSTDRVNDPANTDLLLEAWIEVPELRPAASRFIRNGKNYRPLFEQGYDGLSEKDRVVLVKMGLEWEEDFSGDLVEELDDDYEDFGPELRQQIILVLQRVDGEESVERLSKKFGEGAPAERAQIIESLVHVKHASSTPTLIEFYALCSGEEKQTVINGLARKASPPSLGFVRKTAEGNDEGERKMALAALVVAGSPALDTALQVACHDNAEIRRAGGEAVADIVKLVSKRYILRTIAKKAGGLEAKRATLEKMQADAKVCGEYQVRGIGERSISGRGRSPKWTPFRDRLAIAKIEYSKGILTVSSGKTKAIGKAVDQNTFILPLDQFHRESFSARGREARCTIAEDGGIVGEFIGEPGYSSSMSSDFDSTSIVSYKVTGLVFTKKK